MIINDKKTTILITSIILSVILVTGSTNPAHAGGPTFPQTPGECNANVAGIGVSVQPKATSDPAVDVPVSIFASNLNPPPTIQNPNPEACEAVLFQISVRVDEILPDLDVTICTIDLTNEITNNDTDPTDGGLTIPSNTQLVVDDGTLCKFNTNPAGPTPANTPNNMDMKWQLVPIIAPGDYIVKDGNDNMGDAGIAATVHEQAVEISLDKVAASKCIADAGDEPDKFCDDVEYTFTATLESFKRNGFGPEVKNCFITDDTLNSPVAGPFDLTPETPVQQFMDTFDVPFGPPLTNNASLDCMDQFNNQIPTEPAQWTITPHKPSVDITKESQKTRTGEIPIYKFTVLNDGTLPLANCIVDDQTIGFNSGLVDEFGEPLVLGTSSSTMISGVLGSGPLNEALKNTVTVECDYQVGEDTEGKVMDMDMITVTPVDLDVDMSKECDTKEVILEGTTGTVDCLIKVWKTAGSPDLSNCTVVDDQATPGDMSPETDDDQIIPIALLSEVEADPLEIPISYDFDLDQAKAAQGVLTNKATVECDGQEMSTVSAEAEASTTILFPAISVTKECVEREDDGEQVIDFTWKVTNNSPDMMTSLSDVGTDGFITCPDGTEIDPFADDVVNIGVLAFNGMHGPITFTVDASICDGDDGDYRNDIDVWGTYQILDPDGPQMVHDDAFAVCEITTTGNPAGCTPGGYKGNYQIRNDFPRWQDAQDPDFPSDSGDAWYKFDGTDVTPDRSFESIFGPATLLWSDKGKPQPINDATLLQALEANGGGENALARHCTAAFLNALNASNHPFNTYFLDVDEVVTACSEVFADGTTTIGMTEYDVSSLKELLAFNNELGCFENAAGIPQEVIIEE